MAWLDGALAQTGSKCERDEKRREALSSACPCEGVFGDATISMAKGSQDDKTRVSLRGKAIRVKLKTVHEGKYVLMPVEWECEV